MVDAEQLKRAMLAEYGSFTDKRIKDLGKGRDFYVDAREQHGLASDGSLYGSFCGIVATVVNSELVTIRLSGLPVGEPVVDWAAKNSIQVSDKATDVTVGPRTVDLLTTLASALREVVAPGAPWYPVPSYKYSCPRTADSLDRLARVLGSCWKPPESV